MTFYSQHNLEKCKEQLFYSGKLKTNIYYVVLVKIRKGDVYYTAGKRQYSLYFNDFQDKNFERFFEFLTQILNKLFEEYDNELDYSCDSVLLDLYPIDELEKFKQKEISNLQTVKNELSKNSLNMAKGS